MRIEGDEGAAGPAFGSRLLALACVAASLALVGCGGAASPTSVPTPTATPTPVPTPTPDPNVPPPGSGCGKPYPPPISRFKVKVMYKLAEYYTVDSTPLVGPDVAYCASIGFDDGRSICTVRQEGVDDRLACELWRSGTAQDTGQPGPTWTWIEFGTGRTSFCSSAHDAPCGHLPNAQFTVKAYKGGTYRVCTEAGACGEVPVER
jgi:hypothetical protein